MASQDSSEYYFDDDSQILNALEGVTLPGDVEPEQVEELKDSQESEELEPPPPAQPQNLKRTFSQSQEEDVDDGEGLESDAQVEDDEAVYGASRFGDFGQYMRRKRAKLQIQNADISEGTQRSRLFKGLAIYVSSVQLFRLVVA